MRSLSTIFWLGIKELRSFFRDWVLLGLVVYSFSLAVIAQAQSNSQELHNASIAVVDEDHSELSRRIARAFLPPYFKPPQAVPERDVDHLMNTGATHSSSTSRRISSATCWARRSPVVAGRRRCHRHGAGRHRIRLHPADHLDGDRRLRVAHDDCAAAAGQSLGAHRLQSQCHDRLVHQRHGHHQQRDHAGDHPGRRRGRARARARHHGSSAGHADHARSRSPCRRSWPTAS